MDDFVFGVVSVRRIKGDPQFFGARKRSWDDVPPFLEKTHVV